MVVRVDGYHLLTFSEHIRAFSMQNQNVTLPLADLTNGSHQNVLNIMYKFHCKWPIDRTQ